MTNRLTTQRLLLRRPDPQDQDAYVTFYGSDRRAATAPRVPADLAARRFAGVLNHWEDKGFGRFVVTDMGSEDVLGMVGPHHPGDYPEPEICWHIWTDAAEGKGIAFEAAQAAQRHALLTLKLTSLVSYIRTENTRSIPLAERLGATPDADAPYPDAIGEHVVYRHPQPGDLI